jgi:hypothetical protein
MIHCNTLLLEESEVQNSEAMLYHRYRSVELSYRPCNKNRKSGKLVYRPRQEKTFGSFYRPHQNTV